MAENKSNHREAQVFLCYNIAETITLNIRNAKKVKIDGFAPKDYAQTEKPLVLYFGEPGKTPSETRKVLLKDARELQSQYDSRKDFFSEFGFVCFKSETEFHDWFAENPQFETKYFPECENMIRTNLLETDETQQIFQREKSVRLRGQGYSSYLNHMHADMNLGIENLKLAIKEFEKEDFAESFEVHFNASYVRKVSLYNVWRLANKEKPLEHMPLMFVKQSSVRVEDVVPTKFPHREMTFLTLRYNENQEYY